MVREEEALQKAAKAINEGKEPQKPAEPTNKNQTSNAKKEESEKEKILKKWVEFVNKNKLSMSKNNGEDIYLKVEAWNYLFALCKVTPTITDVSRIETTEENDENGVLYTAKAALMPLTKELTETVPIGTTAFGACKVGESDFCKEDYSALSMAQTRAIGKLGRTAYAHLAIACGFKACPWEEMPKQ